MKLGVKVINKTSNTEYDPENFGILVDDSIDVISKKIFLSQKDPNIYLYHPNILQMQVKVKDTFTTLKDGLYLLQYYDDISDPVIYITSLYEVIKKKDYNGYDLEAYNLYTLLKGSSNEIDNLFDNLLNDFPLLTTDDLQIMIYKKLLDFVEKNPDMINVVGEDALMYIKDDINNYKNNILEAWKSGQAYYDANLKLSTAFYEYIHKQDSFQYYPRNDKNEPEFVFTNISYSIHDNQYDSKPAGKFINLSHIFNIFELSNEIPFIVYNENIKRNPRIKIYNNLTDLLPKNVIKSWVLNENIKRKSISYKKVKGLLLKYKMNNSTNIKNNYLSVTINENGLIIAKVSFSSDDEKKDFKEIQQQVLESINAIIDRINSFKGVYTKSRQLQKKDLITTTLSINALLPCVQINKQNFKNALSTKEISKIFDVKDIKNQNEISIYYTKYGKGESEDAESEKLGITVNIKDHPIIKAKSLITIYGASNLNQLGTIVNQVMVTHNISKTEKKSKGKEPIKGKEPKKINVEEMDEEYWKKMDAALLSDAESESESETESESESETESESGSEMGDEMGDESEDEVDGEMGDEVDGEIDFKTNKSISKIKEMRRLNIGASSRECGPKRQPKLDNKNELQVNKESVLIYKGNRYVCSSDQFKYPGFLADNNICCFEKTGKTINTKIQVRPSNFVIKVPSPTQQNSEFTTAVIKVVSDMSIFTDENVSPYFYLNPDKDAFPLVNINNPELIRLIENTQSKNKDWSKWINNQTIWLPPIQLDELLETKNKMCSNVPDLNKRSENDPNAACSAYAENTYFGYHPDNSLPCCFDKTPDIYKLNENITKVQIHHIVSSSKIVPYKHQGYLPDGLNELFNDIIKHKNDPSAHTGSFVRWGVNQDKFTFFNCIIESLSNNELNINDIFELKRYLVYYLKTNPLEFAKLNSGKVQLKYKTVENYIKSIQKNRDTINWIDVLDLIQRAIKCNILVLDVPYEKTKSEKKYDYKNIQLICNLSINQNLRNPFLFLIKTSNNFEIVVNISSIKWINNKLEINKKDKSPIIKFKFDYNSSDNVQSNIVNFFVEYYTSSCIIGNEFPKNYIYDELKDADKIINLLKDTRSKIIIQLINAFERVNYLVTNTGLLVPIKETTILENTNIKIAFVTKMIESSILKNIDELLYIISKLPQLGLKIRGVVVKDNMYVGAMSNYGVIIPVKPTPFKKDETLPILDINYYPDVDDYLSDKLQYVNRSNEWYNKVESKKTGIFNIKVYLAEKIYKNEELKEYIINIVKRPDLPRFDKIKTIRGVLLEQIDSISIQKLPASDLDFMLDNISNEIINDNIENLLLNNLVTPDTFNPNEIQLRDTESLWLNIEDIKNWVKYN